MASAGSRLVIAGMAPLTRTSRRWRRRSSSLASENCRARVSSIAYALTTAMPATDSCTWFERSASPTCMSRLRVWRARPKARAISTKAGYGRKTSTASQRSIEAIIANARAKSSGVCTIERKPGPSIRRTELRSLTQRLIRSPVRQRA